MKATYISILYFFTFGVLGSGLISCSKSGSNNTVPISTDTVLSTFFHADLNNDIDLAAAGDTVYFIGGLGKADKNKRVIYASIPSQRFHWDFGDGDTSNYSIPYQTYFTHPFHIYTTIGSYQVHMAANDTITATPVNLTICKDPLFTRQICNSRIWRGGIEQVTFSSGNIITRNIPDTTFSLSYLSKVDISQSDHRFTYDVNSSDSVIIYKSGESFVKYFASNDSISLRLIFAGVSGPSGPEPRSYLYTFHSP